MTVWPSVDAVQSSRRGRGDNQASQNKRHVSYGDPDKLYIFSDQDTKVKVSVEGMNFSEEQEIKAFEQSEFNIPKDVALMYSKSDRDKPQKNMELKVID